VSRLGAAMTRVEILGLAQMEDAQRAVVCLAAVDRPLRLGLMIPMNEANRLARALGLGPCPCVPIFELLEGVLAWCQGRIQRVVLDGTDAGISGHLYVAHAGGEHPFPCHPGDGLALAQRSGAPLYAAEGALRYACPLAPHAFGSKNELGDVHRWLARVKPEDFQPRPEVGHE
jgi:bifunctional DNase/RNase